MPMMIRPLVRRVWCVAATCLAVAVAYRLFLLGLPFGGDGVLASLRLADGSEYLLTQQNNHSTEPFTVAFYMRSAPDAPWGWCYVDHQALRWFHVAMTYDAASDSVVVTERSTRRAVLHRQRSTFWLNNGSYPRELPAPQEVGRAPDFPFPGA